MAIGAKNPVGEVNIVPRVDDLVGNRCRVRVTSQTLVILYAYQDVDGNLVVAADMRRQLFGTAHFLGDEPAHPGLCVAIQAAGLGPVGRGLP